MGNGGHHIRCGVRKLVWNNTCEGRTLRIADGRTALLMAGAGGDVRECESMVGENQGCWVWEIMKKEGQWGKNCERLGWVEDV